MLTHKLDNGLLLAFATPILMGTLRDHRKIAPLLRSCVLERERRDSGIVRSNRGGWHSTYDLFDWPEPGIPELRRAVETMTHRMMAALLGKPAEEIKMELRITGWANVSRQGGYNRPHKHHGVAWSGIYYVDSGDPDPAWPESGQLELYDPRTNPDVVVNVGLPMKEYMRIVPEAGMILQFPGWLSHFVHPYYGSRERISIAFDVSLTALKLPEDKR